MDQKIVVREKPKFSAQITSKGFQELITKTLQDPGKAQRFTAKIISAPLLLLLALLAGV